MDLKFIVEELGETIPQDYTIEILKETILNSKEYIQDPDFTQEILSIVFTEKRKKVLGS